MSKVHILTADDNGGYSAVIHFNVPIGNNLAGISWQQCIVLDKQNTTVLNLPLTDQAELDAIAAGSVIEFTATLGRTESGGGSAAQVLATINTIVNDLITQKQAELQRKYKHYGRSIT